MSEREFVIKYLEKSIYEYREAIEALTYDYWCDEYGVDRDDEFCDLLQNLDYKILIKGKMYD